MTAAALLALSLALQAQPPRDARPSASGAASIRGRVLSDESRPRPLRRARVTLSRGPVDFAESAITEDDGTFTFSSVPPGRYTLAVAKEGFVAMMYGARRPARPGTPIVLHEREVKDLTVRLPPGGVITGVIIDAAGQPAQGVAVSAFASVFHGATGERRLAPAGQASTSDDRGEYRIYGLAAGSYVIAAQPLIGRPGAGRPGAFEFRISNPRGRAVAPVPVYFPSTTDAGEAQPVAVGAGEERDGIDIRVENVPARHHQRRGGRTRAGGHDQRDADASRRQQRGVRPRRARRPGRTVHVRGGAAGRLHRLRARGSHRLGQHRRHRRRRRHPEPRDRDGADVDHFRQARVRGRQGLFESRSAPGAAVRASPLRADDGAGARTAPRRRGRIHDLGLDGRHVWAVHAGAAHADRRVVAEVGGR